MIKKESKKVARLARHKRVRKNLSGTSETPRLCVFISNTNIYAQIINDESGETLVSSSSLSLKLKGSNVKNAALVGKDIASKATSAKIKTVVFDRNGYLYHGKVAALADAAREEGLKF